MPDTSLTTGQRIKKRRKELKLTQSALAFRIGTDTSTISKWESDIHIPDGDNLIALAVELETMPEWILTGKEPLEANTARLASLIGGEAAMLHHRYQALLPANRQMIDKMIEGFLLMQEQSGPQTQDGTEIDSDKAR